MQDMLYCLTFLLSFWVTVSVGANNSSNVNHNNISQTSPLSSAVTEKIGISAGCDLYDDEYCIKIDESFTGEWPNIHMYIINTIDCFGRYLTHCNKYTHVTYIYVHNLYVTYLSHLIYEQPKKIYMATWIHSKHIIT